MLIRRAHTLFFVLVVGGVSVAACSDDDSPSRFSSQGVQASSGISTVSSASGAAGSGGEAGAGGSGGAGGSAGAGGGTPEHCDSGVQDEDETDVDCGGSCLPCVDGAMCSVDGDCDSGKCNNSICAAPTCTDQVANGQETDVDCGGPNCSPCADLKMCSDPSHCQSGVCDMGTCLVPTCSDAVKNGNESDTDCGGSCTNKCQVGRSCTSANDCASALCDNGICACPGKMAIVPAPGGGAMCIDQVEVSYQQYSVFYAANPPTGSQIPECLWNTDYTPDVEWPATDLNLPVVGVNWCEAYAYCAWASKRLCGKIGGGSSAVADYADPTTNQWHNACSAQGTNDYPYGDVYGGGICNGLDYPLNDTLPVVTNNGNPNTTDLPNCIGGTPTLRHMSGNVAEWEDSCDGTNGMGDNCRTRGGHYASDMTQLRCDANEQLPRSTSSSQVGFRCCL